MKRIAILSNLLAWTAIAPAQPNRCTQDMVVGIYALAYEGYLMKTPGESAQAAPVPEAGLALASIDSQGVVSSMGYQSVVGSRQQATVPGTILVNSDCTGAVDWGSGGTENLVVLRDGEEMHSMMMASPVPPIVSGRWKRISRVPNTVDPVQCSRRAVVGWYVNEGHGFVMASTPDFSQISAVPFATVTAGSISSSGRVVATGIVTFGGETRTTLANTQLTAYQDCTFILAHPNYPPDVWGVVLGGGNELWGIPLASGFGAPVFTATWRRTPEP